MSAFEIALTPNRAKNKKHMETREPTVVVMAPFSAKAIVQFEDVPVGKTAKRTLRILNTADDGIEVQVTKKPNEDHKLSFDWMANVVPAQGEVEMLITWSPLMDVACKETLHLTDNRNFRKDVQIILKSKCNQPKKTTRKFPTISNGPIKSKHVTTLRLKSPTSVKKTHKANLNSQQHKARYHTENVSSYDSTSERLSVVQNKMTSVHNNSPTIVITRTSPLKEKNTIPQCPTKPSAMLVISPDGNNDVKENISPLTPGNVLSLIDNLNFTPATETIATHHKSKIENLASLPTPVTGSRAETIMPTHKLINDLRPRRLLSNDLDDFDQNKQSGYDAVDDVSKEHAIPNKTFEIKRSETFDMSNAELLDISLNDNSRVSFGQVLNKTTTIATNVPQRALAMIQEEDNTYIGTSPPKNVEYSIQKTNQFPTENTENNEQLKRDIKLIGTPLRKYSESMRDLTKSPQAKQGIQGSMPNLNEMENIRSIEQNRYFYQSVGGNIGQTNDTLGMSVIHEQATNAQLQLKASFEDSLNLSNISQTSTVSHNELLFNQNEILAQSSRFNLNEIGLKSRKHSPNTKCFLKDTRIQSTAKKEVIAKSVQGTKEVSGKKRRSQELSFSDATSTDSIASSVSNSSNKAKVETRNYHLSPPKRSRVEKGNASFQRPTVPANASARNKCLSFTQPKKFKLSQTLSLTKKPITPRKEIGKPIKLYDADLFSMSFINPDPFAATTTCDPFLASTMYLDERALERHQIDFKKWLNALVTIPADLDTDCNAKIDVGKLFNEVRNKELTLAPTKEEQSMHYLTKYRMESLRRAAVQLFLSEEMRVPCSKIAVYVKKQAIRIRSDRNLHLDVVLQSYILELLLCFNPLWLRLGLEVVYGEIIHLHSNNDIVGLSTFILNRLFRDKFLEQKYSKAYTLSDEYGNHIKQFTLQKMLCLLLFLDKAKSKRIIKHNPCLFNKKSPHKETKDILLRFSSELLANIGDITRELKRLGYVLQHKQSYLDEFNYAFDNLAVDLRDGIRLTRVMEIILLRDDLTKQLRVPAISRLQRIFNVNLGLRALADADFILKGDITATDIVDGHREKTLSLLWQVIYKFRSPKFHAAARVLQTWWRNSWLRVVIKRRLRRKEEIRREAAATKIQAAFRAHVTRKFVKSFRDERTAAAIVLQKHTRRLVAQNLIRKKIQQIVLIQRWYRGHLSGRDARQNFLHIRSCVVFLQRTYRRRLFAAKLLQAANQYRMQYAQRREAAAMCIQAKWRAYRIGKVQREEFISYRQCIITIQNRYRAKKAMQVQRQQYLKLRAYVVQIQTHYRSWKKMHLQRTAYVNLRQAVIAIQRRRRAIIVMQQQRKEYKMILSAVSTLQTRFRAKMAMQQNRNRFLQLRQAAVLVQRHYRARIAGRQQMALYQKTRQNVIFIQRKLRATLIARKVRVEYISLQYHAIVLQQKFRARKLMQTQEAAYQQLKNAAIKIQLRYRGLLAMRKQRQDYLTKLNAVRTIQKHFRAYKQMRYCRARYRGIRTAVLCLQEYIRGYLQMKRERANFLRLKNACICVQRKYRDHQKMLKERSLFERKRAAATLIQRSYRNKLLMRNQRSIYLSQRNKVITLQRHFRAVLLGKRIRSEYLQKRSTIIKLQQRYRATILMRKDHGTYKLTRAIIIKLQCRIRAKLAMLKERTNYMRQKQAAIHLQQWYRGILSTRRVRENYLLTRQHVTLIQRKWRATRIAHTCQEQFLYAKSKIIFIQRKWRAKLTMRQEREHYKMLRVAAVTLQRHYRARLQMLQVRSQYLLIRSLIICVQRKFRAHKLMLHERQKYKRLVAATLFVQKKYRGKIKMRSEQANFQLLRCATVDFQAHARGYLARRKFQALMTPEMKDILRQRRAARLIQRFWRGYRIRKRFHNTRILIIRKTIKELKETSSVINSVRVKVQDAVRLLQGRFGASETLNVLLRLDRLSRTVPHLLMAHSDFISTFCYGIMAQAIRSEVDKQLIEYCSRIILNLARYNSTTANTFQEGGLVTIAQMLLRWCDKDCEIFNTLCTLIWVFAHCPEKRKIIRDFMTTTDAIYMVRETKKLVARKEKMKQKVRNNVILGRNNPQTFSSRALPSLEPDYGIIRNQPYTFISSVYAFDTILCKLGIDIF